MRLRYVLLVILLGCTGGFLGWVVGRSEKQTVVCVAEATPVSQEQRFAAAADAGAAMLLRDFDEYVRWPEVSYAEVGSTNTFWSPSDKTERAVFLLRRKDRSRSIHVIVGVVRPRVFKVWLENPE